MVFRYKLPTLILQKLFFVYREQIMRSFLVYISIGASFRKEYIVLFRVRRTYREPECLIRLVKVDGSASCAAVAHSTCKDSSGRINYAALRPN